MKLKAKGFPVGIGLAHHDDSRALVAGHHVVATAAAEVAKDGKTITYNTKEMRDAPQVHARRSTRTP